MRSSSVLITFLVLAGTWSATPVLAQSGHPVLREGDHVLSLGNVRNIFTQLANDNGLWFAEVTTDNGDTSRDGGILRNGFLTVREGTLVPFPVGATIQAFKDVSVNAQGHLGWPLDLKDTAGGNNDDEGLFWNTLLLAQEGTSVGAPEVPADATHGSFKAAKINDRNTLLLTCDIEIEGNSRDALILYRTDGAGNVTSRNVLFQKGDEVIPGESIRAIAGNTHTIALNNEDGWLCQVQLTEPSVTNDTVLVRNGEIVLREGEAAFQAGRSWSDLANPQLDMNDLGDWVASAQLNVESPTDGLDNSVIVRNGEKFVQEGDTFPSIAPYSLVNFLNAPVYIGNSGDVFWFGQINNPDNNANQAYFRNRDVIIQQGQLIGPDIVTTVRTGSNAFHASPSGRFWIGEVGLQNIGDTLILADFGLVAPLPGCSGNPGTVAVTGGAAVAGGRLTFGMDQAQAVGAIPYLLFSTRQVVAGSNCGIDTSLGEVLIALGGARIGRIFGIPWNGLAPSHLDLNLPADPSLVELEFFAQGFFWDINGTLGAERFRLTNGLRLQIGAG